MKQNKFTKLMYLLCIFLFMFGVLYLMWTGANYLFIENHSPRANTLDVVMIVIIAWYTTKDVFLAFYDSRRAKKHEDMSNANHQHRNR